MAGAVVLGLPLGEAIPWGILASVSVPGLIAGVLYASTLKNVHVPLNQNLLQEDDSLAQIKTSRFTAVMPIIVPVLLIIGQTATDVFMPGTTLAEVMSFIGAPLSVLIIGCLLAVFTQIKGW